MNDKWNGYAIQKLRFENHEAVIVYPEEGTANGQLAMKALYWDAFPEAIEIPLLENGFHLCYIRKDTRFGTDDDLDRMARFLRFVQSERGLGKQCVLVGMSCGGMISIKMAARYPELVKCLYLDAPVVNYMSWPCGFGIGSGVNTPDPYAEIFHALQMKTVAQIMACRDMPLDKIPTLVANRTPVVMVAGDSDQVVPYCENGFFLERAYKDAGADIEVYIKPGGDHHPHGLPDSTPIVDFIIRHCE